MPDPTHPGSAAVDGEHNAAHREAESVVAHPPAGPFVGSRAEDGILRFPGIRFATAERFQRPVPLAPHADPVDARAPGAICPQVRSGLAFALGEQTDEPPQSEDCLNLAIATPALDGDRPVMVWVHGGGFLTGGGTLPWYDGGRLAADGDVVVVSVNYRLGAFGYLRHDGLSEGNLGLADQILALEWVQANIGAFGGDPENITVFGQSAGGLSTLALLSVARSRALIRRALVHSSPSRAIVRSQEDADDVGEIFTRALGQDARTASVEEILAAQAATKEHYREIEPGSLTTPFAPSHTDPFPSGGCTDAALVEGPRLPDLTIGYTSEECAVFAARVEGEEARQSVESLTQTLMIDPAEQVADVYAAAGGTVYTYEFSWAPENGGFGAVHGLEAPFLLGTERAWRDAPMLGDASWSQVEDVGRRMRLQWSDFARHGSFTSPDAEPTVLIRNRTASA